MLRKNVETVKENLLLRSG